MDILYLLIPLSVVLVFLIMGIFAWAIHSGQFDDLEREGARILDPSHQGLQDRTDGDGRDKFNARRPGFDQDQALQASPQEQSETSRQFQ